MTGDPVSSALSCARTTTAVTAFSTVKPYRSQMKHAGRRQAPELFRLDASTAFTTIWTELYGEEVSDPSAWERYGPLIGLPMVDSFDPWNAYILEEGSSARFLWQRLPSGPATVNEAFLDPGEFDTVTGEFMDWMRDHLANAP